MPAPVAQTEAELPVTGQEVGVILLCDDDPDSRLAMRSSLQKHGYEVVEAETGTEAIAYAEEVGVDAILLDLTLPGMNGWQTLRQLKSNAATSGIPVVVLSVFAPPERNTLAIHPDGWIIKPHQEGSLLRELARVVRKEDDRASVLLVEDDEDLARIIMATFEQAGVNIYHASSRLEAIALCEHIKPGIMILDLSLPDGDGLGVVDWLRQRHDLQRLPLVVYSARDVTDAEREQLQLGPTEFLTKTRVQPQEVEFLVRTMLRHYTDSAVSASAMQVQPDPIRVH